MVERISFEENAERLKVTIPLKRIWGYWLAYTAMLLTWLTGSYWAITTLVSIIRSGEYGFEGLFLFAWFVIVFIIAAFWYYLGRNVWRRWQYYTANREILFFYTDKLVVRRPLSLLGITDAYAWQHISPFLYDKKYNCPAFDYGTHRIPVGTTLAEEESRALIGQLNERFFPQHDEE